MPSRLTRQLLLCSNSFGACAYCSDGHIIDTIGYVYIVSIIYGDRLDGGYKSRCIVNPGHISTVRSVGGTPSAKMRSAIVLLTLVVAVGVERAEKEL